MTKFSKNSKRLLGAAAACALLVGWSVSSQAQTCTVSNWAGGPTNLTDANTGPQGADNRRYAGPCGLRVPVDGTARYLTDNSPAAESTYIGRFYTFLDNVGTDPIILFEANDGTEPQIQVWYNVPNASDMTLRVFDAGSIANDSTFAGVGSGWHSVEFAWEAAASAQVAFSLNGAADQVISPDTSGITIANALLGNVGGAGVAGSSTTIDFDDFDSRRTSRPGRLVRGDANGDGVISGADNIALLIERLEGTLAGGQADCNEDGEISGADNICLLILRLAP